MFRRQREVSGPTINHQQPTANSGRLRQAFSLVETMRQAKMRRKSMFSAASTKTGAGTLGTPKRNAERYAP